MNLHSKWTRELMNDDWWLNMMMLIESNLYLGHNIQMLESLDFWWEESWLQHPDQREDTSRRHQWRGGRCWIFSESWSWTWCWLWQSDWWWWSRSWGGQQPRQWWQHSHQFLIQSWKLFAPKIFLKQVFALKKVNYYFNLIHLTWPFGFDLCSSLKEHWNNL